MEKKVLPGFAEARMEVRAYRVAIIPALVIDTVCCSIASCRIALIWREYRGNIEVI